MDFGDVPSWVSVAVAAVAAVIGAVQSWRWALQSKRSALEAGEQAKRANAIRDSMDASLESIAGSAKQEANRYDIPWKVEPGQGQFFSLTNDSPEEALDVTVETDSRFRGTTRADRIPAGSSLRFQYVGVMGSTRRIEVTWRRPVEDEHRHWQGYLPGQTQ